MKRVGWLLALALPAALGLAWAALHVPVQVPAFRGAALSPAAPQGCQSGRTVADQVEWSRTPDGAEANFWSSGLLRLQVCSSGTLSFTASGSAAQGQEAALSVALGAAPLLETAARQPRVFRLRVNGPGWLTFGFPNDLYRPPEDRNLFLRRLTFTPD